MDASSYLDIHSFSSKKKKILTSGYSHLSAINSVRGYDTASGQRSLVSRAQFETNWLNNKQNWLDANDRGYEMNYEVIEAARDILGAPAAKPVGAAFDPVLLPTAVIGVEIANAVLWVEHKAIESYINWYFD